jgi:hypothetical protein
MMREGMAIHGEAEMRDGQDRVSTTGPLKAEKQPRINANQRQGSNSIIGVHWRAFAVQKHFELAGWRGNANHGRQAN